MSIHPQTLKVLRERQDLSQRELAEQTAQIRNGAVSKRQISRIESGQTSPDKVRRHTVECLAKALKTTPEALRRPLEDDEAAEASWREMGYRSVKVLLDRETRLNFKLVMHHYDVTVNDLIDAAPWMFTLLAEASLAERKHRVEDASVAFDEAMKRLPEHLRHGAAAQTDFDGAYQNEIDSISARDIFGSKILDEAEFGPDPFDPRETNPFFEFVRRMAGAVGSDAIDEGDCEFGLSGTLPSWGIFQAWLDKLTDGEQWARRAIEYGHAHVDEIPKELLAEHYGAERATWLASQIPPEERERMKKHSARFDSLADDLSDG